MSYQIKRFFEVSILLVAFLALSFVLIGVGTYYYFLPALATRETIMNSNDTGLTLLDDNNTPFFTFYQAKNRKYVPLSEISPHVKNAAIAVEDKEFYKHNGFSVRGMIRSAALNLATKKAAYGGSTITQQLVKNSLLTQKKTIVRKFQELILAHEIENRYDKDEILEMYLNSVYFGQGTFGVEDAANVYYGKSAAQLNLAESSFLIGLLPAPSHYSPYGGDMVGARSRQSVVLSEMQEEGYISPEAVTGARTVNLVFKSSEESLNNLAPHFALMVRDTLIDKYSEEEIVRSGFKVKTTLNSSWQRTAEASVRENVEKLYPNRVSNGAAVVMDPKNGDVKALVGSVNWYNNKFGMVNMATTPRQPGSSFKPIVYGTAFEDRLITAGSVLADKPTTFKIQDCQVNCTYKPKNYDGRNRGNVLVRRALANSLNIPAVQVMEKVGVARTLQKSRDLGIDTLRSESDYGLSLVLGSGEVPLIQMVQAYSAFATQGELHKARLYTEIMDKTGKNIYSNEEYGQKIWSPEVAFLISSILSDNRARAEMFGPALTISRPAAVKTGTTENYRDAWTIGYTPDLVIGVWVGNNDNRPMDNVAGSLGAAPIWRDLMEKFHAGLAVKNFEPPGGIVRLAICASNGGLVRAATTSAAMEYFIPGTEPSKSCGPSRDNIAASASAGFEYGVGGAPPTQSPAENNKSEDVEEGQIEAMRIDIKDKFERRRNRDKSD